MRSEHDVQLSLQRYMGLVLPDYEIRGLIEQGTLPDKPRPYATVAETSPANYEIGGILAVRDATQGYAVVVFPEPADDGKPHSSRAAAAVVEARLYEAFQLGGIDGSRPMRIPLYDWADATIEEANDTRTTKDFIRVRDWSCRAVQSPSSEMLFSVVCEMRCGWSRAGLLAESGILTEEVRIGIDAS